MGKYYVPDDEGNFEEYESREEYEYIRSESALYIAGSKLVFLIIEAFFCYSYIFDLFIEDDDIYSYNPWLNGIFLGVTAIMTIWGLFLPASKRRRKYRDMRVIMEIISFVLVLIAGASA